MSRFSRIGRAFELAKTLSKIGMKELSSGSAASRIEQAKILVESLGQLKGAAMKAGQILSLDLHDYFPPEAVQILAQLQDRAKESPSIDVKATLKRELTPEALTRLTNVQIKPFASASLGQVYKAKFDEKPVAIKLQHPGLDGSVDTDLILLRRIFSALCFITGREFDLEPIFKEFETILKLELNYLEEAKATNQFHSLIQSHKWRYGKIESPRAFLEVTTRHVLTTEFVDSFSFKDWLEQEPTIADRTIVGQLLLELFVMEFFVWGLVQTDPNPGNFLLKGRHNPTLVALDFGASKVYSAEFRKTYLELVRAIHDHKRHDVLKRSIEFGLLDERESEESKEIFYQLLKHGMSPFQGSSNTDGFDFSDDKFLKENAALSRLVIQKLKYSPPPYQLIFLHRKLGGVFALLRKLSVKIDVQPFWNMILEMATHNERKTDEPTIGRNP